MLILTLAYTQLCLLLLTCRLSVLYRLTQALLLTLLVTRAFMTVPGTSLGWSGEMMINGQMSPEQLLHPRSLLDVLSAWILQIPKVPAGLRLFLGDLAGLMLIASVLRGLLRLTRLLVTENWLRLAKSIGYSLVRDLPAVRAQLRKEQDKLATDLDRDLKERSRNLGTVHRQLPIKGVSAADVMGFLRGQAEGESAAWKEGRVSGAIYYGDDDHNALLNSAFSLYSIANPLHPELNPSGMKLESEVISMTAALVRGTCESVCGCTTSGGTESIILAIKAHRDLYCRKYGISEPEVVCCVSAHAAVDKACDLMGLRQVRIPMDDQYCMSLSHLRRAIGPNTIMVYASAPSYPQGTIDPITEIGRIAQQHGIGLHVDCCLGGFVLPFAKRLGYSLPDFDFNVLGVTSMSLDTHKYGYALKGSSVVLYRTEELRQAQYFCYGDWSGGLYTTPTLAGSRSTGLIAQCWASMVSLGEEGYLRLVADIMTTARDMAEGVRGIPGLRLLGRAEAMIVCFAGEGDVNVYSVGDAMGRRGWSLNSLQHPASVHMCCTVRQVGQTQAFLRDLRECVEEVRGAPELAGGKAAVYGATSALPEGPVNELLKVYNDIVLKM
jgi:sphinganine-1-phosphate aldolase